MRVDGRPLTTSRGVGVPRCCRHHDDWPTLAKHLLDDFPEVDRADVVRELRRAREAVEHVRLPGDELDTAELIARHQLMMLTGRTADVARLDPEHHARGS